jgi:hypothetical protein
MFLFLVFVFVNSRVLSGKEFNEKCNGKKFYVFEPENDGVNRLQDGFNKRYGLRNMNCVADQYCHIDAIVFRTGTKPNFYYLFKDSYYYYYRITTIPDFALIFVEFSYDNEDICEARFYRSDYLILGKKIELSKFDELEK